MTSTPDAAFLNLRPAREADFATCAEIAFQAFRAIAAQHNFPEDFPSAEVAWQVLKERCYDDGWHKLVAEVAGRLAGSCFMDERGPVARIGPITVSPEAQNCGVGRALMQAMIDRARARGVASVRLVQVAYHARSLALYLKLGFDPVAPLSNLQGPSLALELPGCRVRQARLDDLASMDDLQRRAYGFERLAEARAAILAGSARVVERAGRITAYTNYLGFDGHAVGETNDDLKALIAAAPGFQGPGILVPTLNAELLRWCTAHGLRVVQPLTVMVMGDYQPPRLPYLPSINA